VFGYSITPITVLPEINVQDDQHSFSPELVEAVDKLWAKASASNRELHDGRVFAVESVDVDLIVGSWLPYRFFYASNKDAALAPRLPIFPLAVTGICHTVDYKILLGRRNLYSTQSPGDWDILPAGSVDLSIEGSTSPDVATQLMSEMREEVGNVEIESVTLQYFARQPNSGPVDLVYLIKLASNDTEVTLSYSDEHTELLFFDLRDSFPDGLAKSAAAILEMVRATNDSNQIV